MPSKGLAAHVPISSATPGRQVPTTMAAGVPSGFRRDPAGATAAGLAFLRASPEVIAMPEPAVLAAQRVMATTAAGDALAADLHSKLAALRDGFGPGPLGYRVAPLAVRAEVTDADHADVVVWFVAVT